MMKWGLNIIFLLGVSFSYGQQLSIHLDKEEVQIGEPFKLTYSIISDAELDSIVYFDYEDFYPGKNSGNKEKEGINAPYEIEISKPFSDTTYKEGNQFIWKGSYELVAWDSAFVILPPEIITIEDSIFVFPAGLIHVLNPQIDATQPIYDIHESFTELPPKNAFLRFIKQHWWWVSIAAVLLIGVGIYLIKRSKKEPAPISLREKALIQINELERSKSYEINLKEYYFDLSVILRKFFAEHYQCSIMDKTTAEIEVILAKNKLDKNMIYLTRQLLMQSDLVKFAKSIPELKEIEGVTNDARKVVNEIADIDLNDGE